MNLEEVFCTFYDKIYSFALMRAGMVHDAEDITADVFLKVAEEIDFYNYEKAAFSTWIFTIALNEIRAFCLKREPRYPVNSLSEFAAQQLTIDEGLLQRKERARLYKAIDRLDERSKEVILLRYFAELPNRRIAEVMGLSEADAMVTLHRAKKGNLEMEKESDIELVLSSITVRPEPAAKEAAYHRMTALYQSKRA
jgi:RNA polymerase sigma-70 factor (ECF subfamily)